MARSAPSNPAINVGLTLHDQGDELDVDVVVNEEEEAETPSSRLFSASHAARCVACHGVRSYPVPAALVGECSIPVV